MGFGNKRPSPATLSTSEDHAVRNGSWRYLVKRPGAALEVKVAESSLVPALDAAALKCVADQRFTTQCPGTRYDLRVRFEPPLGTCERRVARLRGRRAPRLRRAACR